mmetsp:Transcript_59001/g.67197  ORF Transcript_59001/g.67197 Transcript_59001/m.67197 type:complete len:147 (-) Transcript_59001:326-766(-)
MSFKLFLIALLIVPSIGSTSVEPNDECALAILSCASNALHRRDRSGAERCVDRMTDLYGEKNCMCPNDQSSSSTDIVSKNPSKQDVGIPHVDLECLHMCEDIIAFTCSPPAVLSCLLVFCDIDDTVMNIGQQDTTTKSINLESSVN